MKIFLFKALRKIIFNLFAALLFFSTLFSAQLIAPKQVAAQCTYVGQCVGNNRCICESNCYTEDQVLVEDPSSDCASEIVGGVEAPPAVNALNILSEGEIGLIFFLSRLITFVNIVAGILVMLNFVYAGFLYITGAGSSSNMSKINERLLWSFVGILVIVSSYTLAAIFGLIFYGDATFILTPVLDGILTE